MFDEEDDELKKREGEDTEGDPDEVIAGPDAQAPVDPQIMTMTGAPPAAAVPGQDMFRRHGMPGQEQGPGQGHGWGQGMGGGMGHNGWLQQIMQRIQAAHAQREQGRGERFQQFAQTPFGQQFMQGPMGQRIAQRHPDWMPAPAAPAGAPPPAAIVEGDHTGQPAPAAAAPPTAAQAANAQATQAQAAATPATPAAPAQRAQAPSRDQARPSPMGVARPAPQQQRPTLGGAGANAAIQEEMRRRMGGGIGGGMGGGRRQF